MGLDTTREDKLISSRSIELENSNGNLEVSDIEIEQQADGQVPVMNQIKGWVTLEFFRKQHRDIVGYVLVGASRQILIAWAAVYGVIGQIALAGYSAYFINRVPYVNYFGHQASLANVVSILLTVEGLVNLFVGPLYGYYVNASSYRTAWLRITNILFGVFVVILACILFNYDSHACFLAYCVVLVLAAVAVECNTISQFAYLPELDTDIIKRTSIQAKQQSLGNFCQLVFIGFALLISALSGFLASPTAKFYDKMYANARSAQIGAVLAIAVWIFPSIYGSFKITSRKKPESFPGVWATMKLCYTQYSQLSIFFLSYAFFMPGVAGLIGLGTSYLSSELGVAGVGLQLLVGLIILVAIPSALASKWLLMKTKSLKWALVATLLWWLCLMIIPVPFLVTGQDYYDSNGNVIGREPTSLGNIFRFVIAIVWGIGLGVINTISTSFSAEYVPGGAETAFFGIRTIAGKALAWLPPLLYTVISAKNSLTWAFLSLAPFPALGLIVILFFDTEKAKAQIADTLDRRQSIHSMNTIPKSNAIDPRESPDIASKSRQESFNHSETLQSV